MLLQHEDVCLPVDGTAFARLARPNSPGRQRMALSRLVRIAYKESRLS